MRRRGYTLLEVLIAITILAIAFSILIGTQANSALMTEKANRMALAALMARSQMMDIEGELMADGFSDMMETMSGDFGDYGYDEMEWEAIIEVIEIPEEAAPEFAAEINRQLFGAGDESGSLAGSDSVSQWLPMIFAELPNFINQMAQRARRVTLTITWPDGRGEMSLTIQSYVVNLRPGGSEVDMQPVIDPSMAIDPAMMQNGAAPIPGGIQ